MSQRKGHIYHIGAYLQSIWGKGILPSAGGEGKRNQKETVSRKDAEMTVTVTEVTLTDIGLSLVIMDHEFHDNLKTLRRLRAQKKDIQDRIDSIENRNADLTKYISASINAGAGVINDYNQSERVPTYSDPRFAAHARAHSPERRDRNNFSVPG